MKLVFCHIEGLYEYIRGIEKYIDSLEGIMREDTIEVEDIKKWTISQSDFKHCNFLSIDDKGKGTKEKVLDDQVLNWQKRLYESFLHRESEEGDVPSSCRLLPKRPKGDEHMAKSVIHLYTHKYPWDTSQLVYAFAFIDDHGVRVTIV